MPFIHTVRPRYSEVDMQGVVFNGHWLTYFDDSMTRYFEHLGFNAKETWLETDWDAMLVKAVLEWKGGAGWDDEVSIAVRPVRLGTSSFDLRFEAAVGERPVCEGTITYVCIARGKPESRPIPEAVRAALEGELGSGS